MVGIEFAYPANLLALVALPATLRHHRAGVVRWDAMLRLLPFGVVFILIGVEVSNRVPSDMLKAVFGVFLLYVVFVNARRLIIEVQKIPRRKSWDFFQQVDTINLCHFVNCFHASLR